MSEDEKMEEEDSEKEIPEVIVAEDVESPPDIKLDQHEKEEASEIKEPVPEVAQVMPTQASIQALYPNILNNYLL